MNLEVLFVSAGLTGNSTLKNIAISHADKTRINHFRPDASTYHVVHYSTVTGNVTSRVTSQGYADWSTWSRGQSWAIYGFANSVLFFAARCLSNWLIYVLSVLAYWSYEIS